MSASYIVCHDCKTIIETTRSTRVRVHADVDGETKPTLAAYVCRACLDSGRYAIPVKVIELADAIRRDVAAAISSAFAFGSKS